MPCRVPESSALAGGCGGRLAAEFAAHPRWFIWRLRSIDGIVQRRGDTTRMGRWTSLSPP